MRILDNPSAGGQFGTYETYYHIICLLSEASLRYLDQRIKYNLIILVHHVVKNNLIPIPILNDPLISTMIGDYLGKIVLNRMEEITRSYRNKYKKKYKLFGWYFKFYMDDDLLSPIICQKTLLKYTSSYYAYNNDKMTLIQIDALIDQHLFGFCQLLKRPIHDKIFTNDQCIEICKSLDVLLPYIKIHQDDDDQIIQCEIDKLKCYFGQAVENHSGLIYA